MRFIVKSLLLFVGMHYSWLFYNIYVSTNSHERRLVTTEHRFNDTFQKNFTISDVHSLNSTMVPSSISNTVPSSNSNTGPHCKKSVFVLIIVFSAPTNFDRRSIIRNTWAQIGDNDRDLTSIRINGTYTTKSLVKTVFLLGQTNEKTQSIIEIESQHYNDILIGSFVDSYGNLTLKAKFGLEWAQQFCKFKYYLKTDDDVFVYSKGVVKWLWQLPREGVYTGRCDFNKPVIRTAGSKW